MVDEFDGPLVHCNPPMCPPRTFMKRFEDQFFTTYNNRFTCKACDTDKRFSRVEKLCLNSGDNAVSDGGGHEMPKVSDTRAIQPRRFLRVFIYLFGSLRLVKGVCRASKPGY